MKSFHSSLLARKVADMVQNPTQTVGGSNGKMLASAAIIIGSNEMYLHSSSKEPPVMNHNLWRIDPTGQFWKCSAAAVGKGAGNAEATFLRQVEKWKSEGELESEKRGIKKTQDQIQDLETLVKVLTNKDVKGYFSTLSFEEAVILACRCCASAMKLSDKQLVDPGFFDESGIHGIIIRKMKKRETVHHEMVHSNIMKEAFKSLAMDT